MRLEADRLLMRPFVPEDLADLHAILGDDETMRCDLYLYGLLRDDYRVR